MMTRTSLVTAALLGGFLLAGCQSTKPSAPAVDATELDAKIAKASQTLAKQCTLLAVAISIGEAWASNPKVDQALVAAEAARQRFCAAPPKDTATAIQAVADMAIAVNAALAQANAGEKNG